MGESSDIQASVEPAIRRVMEGEDAVFLCNVSGDNVGLIDIAYSWVAHHSILSERRFQTTDGGQGFKILQTNAAENNTDVTCSVRSFETQALLSSDKSRLIVMPYVPITPPQELTNIKTTTKQTRTSTERSVPTTTLTQHQTQARTEVVGKTGLTGSEGVAPIAILSGAIVGGILLLLILLLLLLLLWRNHRRQQLEHRATFSGKHSHESDVGVPQMKRYAFMDHSTGEQMAFSETDGFDSPSHRSIQGQLLPRTPSRGSAPDILASCGLDTPDNTRRKMPQPGMNGSESSLSQHLYESIPPTYIVPTVTIDNDGYTDINIGELENEGDEGDDGDVKTSGSNLLEVTNNAKNSTSNGGGPPLDRFGYVELNIDPSQFTTISSEDMTDYDNPITELKVDL